MNSRLLAITVVAALAAAACGDDDAGGSGDTAATPATESPATDASTEGSGGFYADAPATTVASPGSEAPATGDAPGSEAPDSEAPSGSEAPTTGDDALVAAVTVDIGDVLVDQGGFVLYGFTPDDAGTPTCEDACADAWPPVVVGSAELPAGLDASVFTVTERSDGTHQLAAGGWPLYRYAGDISPGDTSGQGVGGVWFAVAPDGTLIM